MPTAIASLTRLQLGRETTPGVRAPATVVLPATAEVQQQLELYRPEHPYGVRVAAGGAGVIVSRGATVKVETELTAEEILWPLLTGLRGDVTPSGSGPYTWTFDAVLDAAPDVATALVEYVRTDGVTNHEVAVLPYCVTKSLQVEFSATEIATLTWEMEGRPNVGGAPTGGLTPYADRAPLPGALARVYLDAAWADLGDTQLEATIRSGTLEIQTGLALVRTVDGRADLGPSHHAANLLTATLELTAELNETGAQLVQRARQNGLAFVRVVFEGPPAGGQPRLVQLDGCFRFQGEPSWGAEEQQVTVSLGLELVQDPATGNALQVLVRNNRATL